MKLEKRIYHQTSRRPHDNNEIIKKDLLHLLIEKDEDADEDSLIKTSYILTHDEIIPVTRRCYLLDIRTK
jgi:hypothetical protein